LYALIELAIRCGRKGGSSKFALSFVPHGFAANLMSEFRTMTKWG